MKVFASAWPKWLIVLLPLWLVVSGGVGLFLHFHNQEQDAFEQQRVFRREAQLSSLADDWRKLEQVIGARSIHLPGEREGLRRAAAMIEGSLGPTNMGYAVKTYAGPEFQRDSWPILTVSTRDQAQAAPIWLIFAYDTASSATAVAESSASLALSLALAQSLVGEDFVHPVRLMWVPHGRADEPLRDAMVNQLRTIVSSGEQAPCWVLFVDDLLGTTSLATTSVVDAAQLRSAGFPELRGDLERCQPFNQIILKQMPRSVVLSSATKSDSSPAQMVQLCQQIGELLRRLAREK